MYEIGQYGDSVGRSYYVMFLSAKALLVKDGYDISSHKSLISIFGREYVKNAYYDAIDTISKEIAHERIIQAEKFIKETERLL